VLRALTAFFGKGIAAAGAAAATPEQELRLATAVLLIEVARADFAEAEVELDAVARLLEQHLGLARGQVDALVAAARVEADRQASLQAFTRQLHEELGSEDKLRIVEMLWRVAHSDSSLDKHEDHLIRKVAGLLYVSHSDLIRIRNRVTDRS
jgi:uncharacterized tellurite resistance protein B-like protein